MDFISFINSQEPVASWTVEKKTNLLNSLATHFGWESLTPPAMTKQEFINTRLTIKIKDWVNRIRKIEAMASVSYDEVDLNN